MNLLKKENRWRQTTGVWHASLYSSKKAVTINNTKDMQQGRSLAQIRGGGGAVTPEQVPGGNSSVNFGDN